MDKYTEMQVKRIDDALFAEDSHILRCTEQFCYEHHSAKNPKRVKLFKADRIFRTPLGKIRTMLEPKSV